ncbi:hypothetical protein [Lysinibacillus sp. RC79]|uniref:hypothetical protein n=1 Tax=Lysinibacillus sp. RC79 TaxID=3156296 RepID=UPI003516FD85
MQKDNTKNLLREVRANTEGATLACLSNVEVIEVHELTQQKNNDSLISKFYEGGYPDRKMIADYCTKYKYLNENIAKEILNDFYKKMDITIHVVIESL